MRLLFFEHYLRNPTVLQKMSKSQPSLKPTMYNLTCSPTSFFCRIRLDAVTTIGAVVKHWHLPWASPFTRIYIIFYSNILFKTVVSYM